MKRILSLMLCVWICAYSHALDITGHIVDPANHPVANATAIVSVNDSIISMLYSDKKGLITIHYEGSEPIDVEVQAIGFENQGIRIENGTTDFTVRLKESDKKTTNLGEVTIEADKSGTVERLANGERFFLSSKAKARKDPFMALKEIPTLVSDPFNATVKTLKGESPLVLINGIEVNSGIKPILPADIECVEVIDEVPTRYRIRGVTSIINIKLREHRAPYVWTELATRHDFPIKYGFGVGYFEVGNEKFSLYGRTCAEYNHHDDSEGSVTKSNVGQHDKGYTQTYDWNSRNNKYDYVGELLFKYVPTSKDYMAIQFYETYSKSFTKNSGEGVFNSDDYLSESHDKNRSSIFTSSFYYKHEFTKSSELVITAGYNNNYNRLITGGREHFGDLIYNKFSLFKNKRNSGNIEAGYTKYYNNGNSLMLGSRTSFLSDRIGLSSQPTFNHHNYDESLYATYMGKIKKVFYMASAGVQTRWLKSGDASNHYVRPLATAGLTYQMNNFHSLRLDYSLSSQAPDTKNLNPYNTSTDSLLVTRGNPYLVPQIDQNLILSYTFNKKRFYLTASAGARLSTDLIEACGFTDDKGIYTSSYENKGKYRLLNSNIYAYYRLGNDKYNANLRCGVNYYRILYTGHSPRDVFKYSCGIDAWLKKFFMAAEINFVPRNYSDITTQRSFRPMAQAQVNYNVTENFYIAVCLQGFAGNQKTRVITTEGTYKSVSLTKLTETGFHPWILMRWNMRKNVKRKIKLGNVLNSNESGINLK